MNQNMRSMICLLLSSSFILHSSSFLRADGGSVLLSEKKDGYRITVFSAPSPFRAGPVDISVLVQDAVTGQPLPQARVTVRMTKIDQPALEYPATQDVATNKLLRAAQFELPAPGRWELEVRVEGSQGSAVVACEVEAAERLPRWHSLWPWIGWPALAITLFCVHELLARRKVSKTGRLRGRGDAGKERRGEGETERETLPTLPNLVRRWQSTRQP